MSVAFYYRYYPLLLYAVHTPKKQSSLSYMLSDAFRQRCGRLVAAVDRNVEALKVDHRSRFARDAASLRQLRSDAATLLESLEQLTEDLRPHLARLAAAEPQHHLPPWRRVPLKPPATASQQRAVAMLQTAWRKRQRRHPLSHNHCPVVLRHNFVRGVRTPMRSYPTHPPLGDPRSARARDASTPTAPQTVPPPRSGGNARASGLDGKHFMSIL